jgi:predicted phage tail protein
VAGTETHATVSGLNNGAHYTFEVDATTRMGTSAASMPSALVMTPPGVPSAPLYPDAFAGDRSVELLWQPPAQDGGSAIASYTVTTAPAGEYVTIPARRDVLPTVTIHRLTNGTRYRFTVYAANAFGHSVKSVLSNIVAPFGPPGAPTRVNAIEQAGHVVVSWTAPASDNGSAINEYRVTAIPGGMLAGVDAPQHTLAVASLTRGRAYSFTVVALNDAANGPASPPSNVLVVGSARLASNPTT